MQDYIRKRKEITAEKIIRQVQEQLIAYMPFMNRAILKMPVEFFETKEEVDDLEDAPTAQYKRCLHNHHSQWWKCLQNCHNHT